MKPLTMSIARARRGVISLAGGLPWRIPEDLRRFNAATMGHTLIVGRVTFETLPPLPGRRLVVATRACAWIMGSVRAWGVASSVGEAIQVAHTADPEPFVIGGARVYRAALPYVTRALVTEIGRDVEGDAFFGVDFAAEGFREVSREVVGDVDFVEWRRG